MGIGSQVTGHVTLGILSRQISQVCQLCQQSPRLFSNHAAQLHTLLVSMQDCLPHPIPVRNPMTVAPMDFKQTP